MNTEINQLIDNNKIDDLKRFLYRRRCLNESNIYLNYLFHLIQSSGILLTSYATASNNTNLIWAGVSLNMVATLINLYEKTNNSLSKKMLANIQAIREGNYLDETVLIEDKSYQAS
jgi:hypothetical protein